MRLRTKREDREGEREFGFRLLRRHGRLPHAETVSGYFCDDSFAAGDGRDGDSSASAREEVGFYAQSGVLFIAASNEKKRRDAEKKEPEKKDA